MRHGARAFVDRLDFLTSLGHGPTGRERRELGIATEGPTLIVTDLCTMRPDPESKEFEVVTTHSGVTEPQVRDNTGWPIRFAERVEITQPPSDDELRVLRDLNERTARAHGVARQSLPSAGRR
jgi:glutaconate CoA-transferase subunit B